MDSTHIKSSGKCKSSHHLDQTCTVQTWTVDYVGRKLRTCKTHASLGRPGCNWVFLSLAVRQSTLRRLRSRGSIAASWTPWTPWTLVTCGYLWPVEDVEESRQSAPKFQSQTFNFGLKENQGNQLESISINVTRADATGIANCLATRAKHP